MGGCVGRRKKQDDGPETKPVDVAEVAGGDEGKDKDRLKADPASSRPTADAEADHGDQEEHIPGTNVGIYKQDPSVQSVGYRVMSIPVDVHPGPRSDDVVILGMKEHVGPSDRQNNYVFSPDQNPDACDSVHTFTVVQCVMNMYRQALDRIEKNKKSGRLTWEWGSAPILVFPHAGQSCAAYYDKSLRVLAFFTFEDTSDHRTVYTCRSLDIVAHETGHAILDSLKPKFLSTCSLVETVALHEAFADLTAIFATLDHIDVCQQVITETKGDLHAKNFLPIIGEEFGKAMGGSFGMEGLRDSDLDVRVTDVVREAHNWSRVFTSAVYDILVRMYNNARAESAEGSDPGKTLYQIGKHLVGITLQGFIRAPDTAAKFRDVADAMIDAECNSKYKCFIKEEFERRLVFDKDARPKPWTSGGSLGSCSTLCVVQEDKLRDKLVKQLLPAINVYVQGRPGR